MKYLLRIRANLDDSILGLSSQSGVSLVMPTTRWHVTVLPPFSLQESFGIGDLFGPLAAEMEDVPRRFAMFDRLKLHQEGRNPTYAISAQAEGGETLPWFTGLRSACLRVVSPLATSELDLYPPHLTIKTGISEADSEEMHRQLVEHFEPFRFFAQTLRVLCRESSGEEWADVGSLILRGKAA